MAAPRGANGRCSICQHPDRARIELLLAGGGNGSRRAVARKFNVSHYALRRHWITHIPDDRRAVLVLGGQTLASREGLAAEVAEQSQSIIDNLRAEAAILWRHLLREDTGTKAAMVAAALTKCYSLLGHFTGELSKSPLISHQHVHLTFHEQPQFVEFIEQIGQILDPYPEARVAVFRAVEEIERRAAPLPQLEHAAPIVVAAGEPAEAGLSAAL